MTLSSELLQRSWKRYENAVFGLREDEEIAMKLTRWRVYLGMIAMNDFHSQRFFLPGVRNGVLEELEGW